jgi:hypothetical protein
MAITKDQRIWTGAVLRDLEGKVIGRLPGAAGPHGMAVSDAGDVYIALLSPQDGRFLQKFVKQ